MQFSRKNRDRLLLKKSYSGDAMKDSEKVAELADLETSYTQLENTIDPFDLIAFKGGDIISSTVVFLTRQSKKHSENLFSHVGIAVNSQVLPKVRQLKENTWYIYESTITRGTLGLTGENVPDVIEEEGRLGVQLRPLRPVVVNYIKIPNAKVALCKLKNNPWVALKGDTLDTLNEKRLGLAKRMTELNDKYGRTKYERNAFQLFAAAIPCLQSCSRKHAIFKKEVEKQIETIKSEKMIYFSKRFEKQKRKYEKRQKKEPKKNGGNCGGAFAPDVYNDDRDAKYLFCSELVAIVYKTLGLIPPSFISKYTIPQDFVPTKNSAFPDLCEKPIYFKVMKEVVHLKLMCENK